MIREIKFRIWDPKADKWFWEPDELGNIIYCDDWDMFDPYDYQFEQFTGLKDKNGKDIYENDILAWHSNVYRKHHWVGLVVYRGAGFVAQDGPKSYSSSEWLECACQKDANLVEVVGNVHEDGQLLEADK